MCGRLGQVDTSLTLSGNFVAFLDESYSQNAFFMCALVVPEEVVGELDAGVAAVLSSYAQVLSPLPSELHAHEIMSGSGLWAPIANATRLKIRIFRKALELVSSLSGSVVFTEGTDVRHLNIRYAHRRDPYSFTLRNLLETLDQWGSSVGARISLVADQVGSERLQQLELLRYQASGTVRETPRPMASLRYPIIFAESHAHCGLQLADLLVYLYRRRDFLSTSRGSARSVRAVESLLEIVAARQGHYRKRRS